MHHMITDAKQRVQELLQDNATTLLTAGGVVGTVTTAVLAWRGGYKTAEKVAVEKEERTHTMSRLQEERGEELYAQPLTLDKMDMIKLALVDALPPVLTGTATVGSIIMANRMSAQKAAALAAAYGLAEKQLGEYKEKVQEKLTGPKAQAIDDSLAQDRVNNTPGASQIVVVEGEVLCFDQPTGRYFRGTMEGIKTAVNRTNEEILHHDHASASYFYEELGLPPTTWSDDVGWNTDHLVELTFSTVLSHEQRPCIAIDFKFLPFPEYIRRYGNS